MTPTSVETRAFPFTLSEEERLFLRGILEQNLRDKRVEEHRTEAFEFKEHVQHQEALLEGLINRLRQ